MKAIGRTKVVLLPRLERVGPVADTVCGEGVPLFYEGHLFYKYGFVCL